MRDIAADIAEMDLKTLHVVQFLVTVAIAAREAVGGAIEIDLVDDGEAVSLIVTVPEVAA